MLSFCVEAKEEEKERQKTKQNQKYTKQQGKALVLKFYRAINQSIKDHRITTMVLLLPKRVP